MSWGDCTVWFRKFINLLTSDMGGSGSPKKAKVIPIRGSDDDTSSVAMALQMDKLQKTIEQQKKQLATKTKTKSSNSKIEAFSKIDKI